MHKALYFSDEAIIHGIVNDDEGALAYLYRIHFPMILHFIQNNNGTDDEAKDIYQESIIVFYEKIKSGTLELNCQIKTYLYSVCRRLWLKRLTEKSKYTGSVIDSDIYLDLLSDAPALEENDQKFTTMEQALNQLGEPCRTLLEDYYFQDLSMQLITEKFGYTNADNAKNQKYKCLMRLKKLFFSLYKMQV
ncbi:MAG: RNA polymerase sigma factor [Bacteroidota bacterium]|nr:RNA polymerase sigma factor [Bacteroidota bacterium]